MDASSASGITVLLRAWSEGNDDALDKLTPLVYAELYRLARSYMNQEGPGHELQNTALVNEVYLRLARIRKVEWQNRGHFVATCAHLMRRILTDCARERLYQKRGGVVQQLPWVESLIVSQQPQRDVLALDEALKTLATLDSRKSRIVELRFFGGLSVAETAEVLNISEGTVKRDWKLAKLWLLRELSVDDPHGQ
jgi:RNA polymerase sigma factor (TIGR02999 family)